MTLRIGGVAAIAFGLLWTTGLAWASYDQRDEDTVPIVMTPIGYVCLIVAIAGLSASRRADTSGSWAAVVIPTIGSIVALIGTFGMLTYGDRPGSAGGHPGAVRGRRPRSRSARSSRATTDKVALANTLIGSGAALSLVGGGGLASQPIFVVGLVAFAAGWVWLHRRDPPGPAGDRRGDLIGR